MHWRKGNQKVIDFFTFMGLSGIVLAILPLFGVLSKKWILAGILLFAIGMIPQLLEE